MRRPWLRQQTASTGVISSERDSVTCATLSRPGARTVQFAAFRSVLTESLLSLPRPPVASCRLRKVVCLLQRASETSPAGPPLSLVPGQSSPDARGTLQTSPIQIAPTLYCNPDSGVKCQQIFSFVAVCRARCFKTTQKPGAASSREPLGHRPQSCIGPEERSSAHPVRG